MKKLLAALVSVILAISLSACCCVSLLELNDKSSEFSSFSNYIYNESSYDFGSEDDTKKEDTKHEEHKSVQNDTILLENNKDIRLIYSNKQILYFLQKNENNRDDLYCLELDSKKVTLVEDNIAFDEFQVVDGYLYYTKALDSTPSQQFKRIKTSANSVSEGVPAVNNGIVVKGKSITSSSVWVYDGHYYDSSFFNGNMYYYIYRFDSNGTVKVLNEYAPPAANLTVYNNYIYFDGINKSEDGVYKLFTDGGGLQKLYKGSACVLDVNNDKVFFSTKEDVGKHIDLSYVSVDGGTVKRLIEGNINNVAVCNDWVYYVDLDDSCILKRINYSTNEIQNITKGSCNNFVVNEDESILYYISEHSDNTQILRVNIKNGIVEIDQEPVCPVLSISDILGTYKNQNHSGQEIYQPKFTLHDNYEFSFEVNNYHGMDTVVGTYTFDGTILTLMPNESSDKIILEIKSKNSFLFMSDMLGTTCFGDVFSK